MKPAWPVLEPGTPLIENWHLEAVCDHLEAVADDRINRLAISLPAGHNKSVFVAVFFNAWVWTRQPHKRLLSAGSSEAFCERDNGKLRNLIKSDWYQSHWPISFPQADTVLRFENEKTGFRWAKSFLSLTGGSGNFLILDDVLPVDQANSEIERNKVNRRFFKTATSRLEREDDSIIIIMQRVHEADLMGEIMDRQSKGEDLGFDTLIMPMEYDEGTPATSIGRTDPRSKFGELICPAYRSQHWVDREKVTMGVYAWSSQYQQQPVPRGNGFFDVRDFKRFHMDEKPASLNHYVTSDHALGLSSNGDYNVIRVRAVDNAKNFWLVDSFRERCSIQTIGIVLEDGKISLAAKGALPFVKKYRALAWIADSDNIIKAQVALIKEAMSQIPAACRLESCPKSGGGRWSAPQPFRRGRNWARSIIRTARWET